MKLIYTDQAITSLQECLDFFPPEVPAEKVNEIRDKILAKVDKLVTNPYVGQREESGVLGASPQESYSRQL